MTVFVICRVLNTSAMQDALKREFPGEFLQLQADEFLVSSTLTAGDLAEKLKITQGGKVPVPDNNNAAMVIAVGGYYGRASAEIWDWMKAKMERPGG